jgi:hypothetical protein
MPPSNNVAAKTRVVVDPNTGVTRQVIAGQSIPPDLVGATEGRSVVEAGYEPDTEVKDESGSAPDLASCTDEELDAYVKAANAHDVLALAGDDAEDARQVLESEVRGKDRKTVVEALQTLISNE